MSFIAIGILGAVLTDTVAPLPISCRKVGGIWFARAWRFRASFCIARGI